MEVQLGPTRRPSSKSCPAKSDTQRMLVEDAVAGYFKELAQTPDKLNSRYDDLKTGRAKPIPGDEVIAHLKATTEAQRDHRS
jgi:hypothetical protein